MTYDELCEEYAKIDSFMEPQVTDKRWWFVIESEDGILYSPDSEPVVFDENARVWSVDHTVGYGARLSAPGYMDCTDWVVFDTEQEAIDYLAETYMGD